MQYKFFCRIAVTSQVAAMLIFGQTPGFLKLVPVEGEGAFNDVVHKTGHPPVIRVVDESNNPVMGAQVTCTLPSIGPGATFDAGGQTGEALTDEKGIAQCPGYKPNISEGRFNIRVIARFEGKVGNLIVSQSNTLAGGTTAAGGTKGKGKLWLLVLVAGGAAGGLAAGLHKSGPAATPPVIPTTVSAGSITVGGPR